jgi:hypothetical protein
MNRPQPCHLITNHSTHSVGMHPAWGDILNGCQLSPLPHPPVTIAVSAVAIIMPALSCHPSPLPHTPLPSSCQPLPLLCPPHRHCHAHPSPSPCPLITIAMPTHHHHHTHPSPSPCPPVTIAAPTCHHHHTHPSPSPRPLPTPRKPKVVMLPVWQLTQALKPWSCAMPC